MPKGWKFSINPKAKDVLNGSANRAVALAAEHVLGVSNKSVPIEEDTLERSGTVSTDPGNFTAAVSYDTPYAVKQHEDMTLRHDNGRSAKYLENAMNSEVQTAAEIIRQTIAGTL
ncbi:hypothetical protein QE394_001102 [Arthrobacter sp. SORGH_AS 212]|uniref:hypothetical protein n=1 Tax=Pseudarthrobacter sp. SORGH_AS 212 TaxID=3041777 RepID=UPI00277D841D|nr:hypothetical protein [Arthrobacter sp. SORGH_AS_0212]